MTGKYNKLLDQDRKEWTLKGMIGKAHKSFWGAFEGESDDSIIYVNRDLDCGVNKKAIFDYSGKLTSAGGEGMDEICDIGEEARMFSEALDMRVFNWMTKGKLKTKACDLDNLDLYANTSSRSKLFDLFYRHKDQFIFDGFIGALKGTCAPSHIYNLGRSFKFSDIYDIAIAAREGRGFVKASANGTPSTIPADVRYPLEGITLSDGSMPQYIMVITSKMEKSLKTDPQYVNINIQGDVRGSKNAILSGHIAKHEGILMVTAPVFAGMTKGKGQFNPTTDTTLTFSGLRRYAIGEDKVQVFEGQKNFRMIEDAARVEASAIATAQATIDNLSTCCAKLTADQQKELDAAMKIVKTPRTNVVYSRGLLLGAAAGQLALGTAPEYQSWATKGKRSYESLLDVFFNFGKTSLTLTMGEDYEGAPVADIDYGVIAVDMEEV